jgi:hypothetical protein
MGNHILYFLARYRILIDASFNNDKRKSPLNPTQISDYDFQVENVFLEILTRKTGQIIAEGIGSAGNTVLVTAPRQGVPYNCNPQTVGPDSMRGATVSVGVYFKPDQSCHLDTKTKNYKPGGTPAESLFHELVHAFRIVTEKASNRVGPSLPYIPEALKKYPTYDSEEEFFTVLITNIFSSETGRPLRKDHDGVEALQSELSTNKGFLAIEPYARLVRQFCTDHPSVSQKIRDVPSAFNPVKEVLIGQGYQYLMNDR